MQGNDRGRERLSWDDVRLLLALGRSRTLGEAARRLGVDGSTVSRRLSALETALASTLFERGRSGITATEAAEELMPIAEEVEFAMARFTGTAETLEREVAGIVRIACPPDAAEVRLVPLLPDLLGRHPRLRVQIEPSERLVDVARRGADLAVRIVRPEQGDLLVKRVDSVAWTAAAAPALARELGKVKRWQDVPWIGWGDRLSHLPMARWFVDHVPEFDPVLRSDSIRVQIAAASRGLGAVVIPAPSVAFFGLARLAVSAKLTSSAAQWPVDDLFLVTHRSLRTVPRVRAVWDFLVERLSNLSRRR